MKIGSVCLTCDTFIYSNEFEKSKDPTIQSGEVEVTTSCRNCDDTQEDYYGPESNCNT